MNVNHKEIGTALRAVPISLWSFIGASMCVVAELFSSGSGNFLSGSSVNGN